jgi:ribosomal protein S18 acetylase RimI-like enzyme
MEVVRLERDQLGEASDVLARAFQDDPAWVWLLPDAERRRRLLPWLFRVGFDVTAADVWSTAGPVLGAARWLPPGRPAMRVGPTLRALVTTPFHLGTATGAFLSYGRAVEQMRAEVADGPHWYLAGIGVDPAAQRRGVGAALLRPGLEAAERAGLPAVLLTNNEANLAFYESHGFAVVRPGRTPEEGPRAWAMVRHP